MSEEKIQELEAKFAIIERIIRLGWALLAGAFALGVWVATLEMREHETSSKVSLASTRLQEIELWRADATSSKYTASDHNRYAVGVSEIIAGHDKRITRLEDSLLTLQKTLDRIEGKLNK